MLALSKGGRCNPAKFDALGSRNSNAVNKRTKQPASPAQNLHMIAMMAFYCIVYCCYDAMVLPVARFVY